MATTDTIVAWWLVTVQGSGFPLLDTTIIETFNRDDILPDHKQYRASMGFVETPILSINQTFAAKSAPKAMDNVLETGIAKVAEKTFTPKKGIYQREISNKYERSKLFTAYAKNAKTLQGAPDGVEAELLLIAEDTRDLALAYDIRYAEDMVKVWAKWFSITADKWPGSATPKGKALFDTHTYGKTGDLISGTFTNFTNWAITFTSSSADILAGTTRLQTLISQLKNTRDENGKFVRQGGLYKLYCSRIREVFWKQVLNNGSTFSGQGSNAMQENQFLFEGNKVELVVLDLLGQPDFEWNLIGTTDMIFVTNTITLAQSKAFKTYSVYPLTIDSWENKDTKVLTTDARATIGMDHFWAELYIVGSTNA